MEFKKWLLFEIAELVKPKNKVRKRDVVKNPGTNVAKKVIQYNWKTSIGNEIKLQFIPHGDDIYEVIFYVNDTLYDDSSNKFGTNRDIEILGNVLYVMKEKADKLGAKELRFEGFSSEGDTKVIKNVDISNKQNVVLNELERFKQAIINHKTVMIQPSEIILNLYKKLNRVPEARMDFNKNDWLDWINGLIITIKNGVMRYDGSDLVPYMDKMFDALHNHVFQYLNFNVEELFKELTDLSNRFRANSSVGFHQTKNRRTAIYKRIVQKYFADEWDIKINHNWFTLIRK